MKTGNIHMSSINIWRRNSPGGSGMSNTVQGVI